MQTTCCRSEAAREYEAERHGQALSFGTSSQATILYGELAPTLNVIVFDNYNSSLEVPQLKMTEDVFLYRGHNSVILINI